MRCEYISLIFSNAIYIKISYSLNFKNINSYAANGSIHYANALLHHKSYTDIIAIGMTAYKDDNNRIINSIGVYYVSRSNLGVVQKIGKYTDL